MTAAVTRRVRVLSALALAAFLTAAGIGAGQAQAAGYRYWSFWDRDGGNWAYATEGPSTARPSDGDVQGFRFSVSEDSQDASKPRGTADFGAVCGKTPAREGDKRVALVLDFGTRADAPAGETPPAPRTACARVPADATTAEALASVAGPLRYDTNALLCAISGYPQKGCGEQVATGKSPAGEDEEGKSPAEGKSESGTGPSVGLLAGGAAVLVLGAAAVWQARRRRDA
ncbi:SCO2322 family protein [Streptomyces kebangsaanensis]|uniref:SCO2322 family protein n=1 Tax=Streptomyces kebangsaanensis TaxID=864058 RepID=A0ABW6KL60_9ACTN